MFLLKSVSFNQQFRHHDNINVGSHGIALTKGKKLTQQTVAS